MAQKSVKFSQDIITKPKAMPLIKKMDIVDDSPGLNKSVHMDDEFLEEMADYVMVHSY